MAENIKRASLWRETVKDLKSSIGMFWPWVAGYILLFAVVSFFRPWHPAFYYKQHPAALLNYLFPNVWITVLTILAPNVFWYFISAFCLRRALLKTPPTLSVSGFFYSLWKTICVLFLLNLLLLFTVAMAIAIKVDTHLLRNGIHDAVWGAVAAGLGILMVLAVLASAVFAVHLWLRYLLVMPLAVLWRKPVIKSSWRLTRGQCWRLLGNGLMVLLVLFLPLHVLGFVLHKISGTVTAMLLVSIPHAITWHFQSLAGALPGVLVVPWQMVVWIAYTCTAYRVLLQEQNPVDSPDELMPLAGSTG